MSGSKISFKKSLSLFAASKVSSLLPKVEKRKKPSPQLPNPSPEVPTICTLSRSKSKNAQLSRPFGHLSQIYGAPSLKAAQTEFEKFKQIWSQYPRAVDVWVRNFSHVEQLFDYGSSIRKIMYTTNAVESVNSSFRKVTKKGAFPNEHALLKLLYLRITELYRKWSGSKVQNWAMVRNQLSVNPALQERLLKYENLT